MPVQSAAIAILCAVSIAGAAAIGAERARAQTSEAPKAEAQPPTGGPKPESLAQPPSETAPVTPHVEERTGSGPREESPPVRPEGPVPLRERPSAPPGSPKEIR